MRRTWPFVLGFLLLSASSLGQSTSSESQGMQALVAEVQWIRAQSASSPLSLAGSGGDRCACLATPQ